MRMMVLLVVSLMIGLELAGLIAIGIEVLTKEEPETMMKINVLEHRCDSMQRQIDYMVE